MLRPSVPDLQVHLHRAPIDMREQRNGLAALVKEVMQQDPFQPAFFLFTNKRYDALKIASGACASAGKVQVPRGGLQSLDR